MQPDSRIYVAGHTGLVGSALVRKLNQKGYHCLTLRTHEALDLTNQNAVNDFFSTEKPEYVFLAAAKVGGIFANATQPADYIFTNLSIQNNVIYAAYKNKIKKLLFLGSSCIYPRLAPQPMREEYLLTGPLEPTNEPYSVAKIAGIKTCNSFNQQYGTNFLSVMPTNLFGPNDNYDLAHSHVIPALIRKIHEARINNTDQVEIWGSGNQRREFLHSDDLADACVFLMEKYQARDIGEFINIGVGHDMTVRELVELIVDIIGYKGELFYNTSKPDGMPQKLLDVSRLFNLGWEPGINLKDGIQLAYKDFLSK